VDEPEPLAIKEEESVAGSFGNAGSFFIGIFDPTVYRCPCCRSAFKVILGPGDIFLGEGRRNCSRCHKAFRDRSKEWPALTSLERFFYLFPTVVCGWVLIALMVCGLLAWSGWTVGAIRVALPAVSFFVIPLMAWFAVRSYQIARSVHRFHLYRSAKAA